ncbi:hypothetical protein QTP70_008701 [Hemibagrus guttatus]|uniref:Alkylated DNA repair protein AlkB homologue 8 N-terminal domain-containing protein n=1 Tax=Hemibagrus guttatus TaxID=175788 RepID=A0AAE0V8G3_9TELE|nr:hypothetical protein QTP70_008701 [Hemibagrus guttatus]
MSRCKDLSEFDKGQIVMARRLDQSISKTAALVGCSQSAVVSIYQKWSMEGTVVNRRPPRVMGRAQRRTDSRVERRLARVIRSNRRATVAQTAEEVNAGSDRKLLKFADDTTVIGLIQDGDESAYRQEIEQLAAWCSRNNLELNTLKTVEMIVDFRRNTPALPPLTIMNSTVPTVASFRFLGTTISQDLKWDTHIDATIKKAQQRLYFLRQLRKFNLPQELLIHFYSAVIESVLCTSITVWFGSATKSDMRRLQRMAGV